MSRSFSRSIQSNDRRISFEMKTNCFSTSSLAFFFLHTCKICRWTDDTKRKRKQKTRTTSREREREAKERTKITFCKRRRRTLQEKLKRNEREKEKINFNLLLQCFVFLQLRFDLLMLVVRLFFIRS